MMPSLFETERIRLQAFEPDDLSSLHAYLNHSDLNGRRYIPWRFSDDLPLSRQQVEGVLKVWSEGEKQFHLAVTLCTDGTLIGHANCNWHWDAHCPNIDLVIAPAFQLQGYGSEALELLFDYLFKHTQAHSVGSGLASWNQEALKFALKKGFTQSGKLRRAGLRGGQFYDWIGVDILRPEWIARTPRGGA
jgi:RimJ/RimL family protein N-acetyltransferase